MSLIRSCAIGMLVVMAASASISRAATLPVEGIVTDRTTGQPIPYVTVQMAGSAISTSTNEEGRYRLLLESGTRTLRFTHIAFSGDSLEVSLSSKPIQADISLEPSPYELPGTTVYTRAYDPAQEIIVEAIRRKQDILSRLDDYEYDAYTKFVVYDLDKEGVESVFLLAESQTTAYWEQPDRYKEVISARRQSGNIEAENNLLTVGEILNFNRNRIDLGKYSLVSPTAGDALDFYNYYLLDTIYLDDRKVFRLEIEPKSSADPLFFGFLDIVDSTYDVVSVDVGLNEAARFPFLDSLRYRQRFARFDEEYWMPVEIRFGGEVHFQVPLPGIPNDLGFAQTASLYSYRFEEGMPNGTFGEYVLEVQAGADDVDSASWAGRQTIPLTEIETAGYRRIDSVENAPVSFGKALLGGLGASVALMLGADESFFRYNRVDGVYGGLGVSLRPDPAWRTQANVGYAFERSEWQFGLGASYRLWEQRRWWLGGQYHDRTVRRSTLVTDSDFPITLFALFAGFDPFDYYKERGFSLWTVGRLVDYVTLRLTYRDYDQESVPVETEYSFFGGDEDEPGEIGVRWNPPIADGDLRSISAALTYDSRSLIKNKGVDLIVQEAEYTLMTAEVEYAGDDFIGNDFNFWRYKVRLEHRMRVLGLGITTFSAMVGGSDRVLPPQRFFAFDHGVGDFVHAGAFFTMKETNFYGDHAAALYLHHDFDQLLFRKSRIPLVEDLPFTFNVYGGAFWMEYRNRDQEPLHQPSTRDKPYAEVGFGLGNITPFLTPFNLAVWCTWQVSDFTEEYDTSRFALNWGFSF